MRDDGSHKRETMSLPSRPDEPLRSVLLPVVVWVYVSAPAAITSGMIGRFLTLQPGAFLEMRQEWLERGCVIACVAGDVTMPTSRTTILTTYGGHWRRLLPPPNPPLWFGWG